MRSAVCRLASLLALARQNAVVSGATLAVGVVLTLAWQVENWRGERALEDAKALLASRGISLEPEDYAWEAVPESSNALEHPLWEAAPREWLDSGDLFFNPEPVFDQACAGVPQEIFEARFPPVLDEWQGVFRAATRHDFEPTERSAAEEVLGATAAYGNWAAGMEEAFKRPHAQLMPRTLEAMETGAVLQIPDFKDRLRRLRVLQWARVIAHLQRGDSWLACRDLTAPLHLATRGFARGILIGDLVRMNVSMLLGEGLENLLALPGWETEDLKAIQALASRFEMMKSLNRACSREAALAVTFIRTYGDDWTLDFRHLLDPEHRILNGLITNAWLQPRGWRDQNTANYLRWVFEDWFAVYEGSTGRLRPENAGRGRNTKISPYTLIAAAVYPQIFNPYRGAAREEARWDLLELLCAVRRYQLEYEEIPNALSDLVPDFMEALPRDAVTGGVPHFTLEKDGSLKLVTLDWDRSGDPGQFEHWMEMKLE